MRGKSDKMSKFFTFARPRMTKECVLYQLWHTTVNIPQKVFFTLPLIHEMGTIERSL